MLGTHKAIPALLGIVGRRVTMTLDGGDLTIEWRESDGHVLMTGPVSFAFGGEVDIAALFYGLFLRGHNVESLRKDIDVPVDLLKKWAQGPQYDHDNFRAK